MVNDYVNAEPGYPQTIAVLNPCSEPARTREVHKSAHRQLNQIAQHKGVACLDQAPAFIKTTEFYC